MNKQRPILIQEKMLTTLYATTASFIFLYIMIHKVMGEPLGTILLPHETTSWSSQQSATHKS